MFRQRLGSFALAAALALAAASGVAVMRSWADEAVAIPPPAMDAAAGSGLQTVTLAGGCFWGVQGVYQHVEGVTSAVSGYAGGDKASATYDAVSGGRTAHAEAVRVTFDPKQVSLGRILQVYFSVAHDPTTLNRQGPDSGPQYRSAIFAATPEQAAVAKAYVAQLDAARLYRGRIVTRLEQSRAFYPAEAYHQDYMARNPTSPYIAINDAPKVAGLKKLLPDLYRAKPVLMASSATN